MRGLILGAAAAAMVAAPAQGACWNEAAAEAAQVREFETMLMVSALRCRTSGADFMEDYNGFVRGSRAALTNVNDRLRRQFAAGSARATLDAYDGYVTSIANRYGAGREGLACEDLASITRAAVATAGSPERLAELAQAAGVVADLPGGRCSAGGTATLVAARR